MWYLERELQISSAHHLENYDGKCKFVHGHNWKITVYCKGNSLDKSGMLIDFSEIKRIVMEHDHKDLNLTLGDEVDGNLNPTAENMALFLCKSIPHCYKVTVEETDGARVTYVEE